MQFIIAKSFVDSLAKLQGADRQAAKLQINPARRFGLPRPDWVDKPEFFLPGDKLEYLHHCKPHGADPHDPNFICWPPQDDDALYRRIARTPKEMLRRGVVYEAHSLTVL